MENKYTELPNSTVRQFLSPFEDEKIYVIKTGFKDDSYIVVFEDAHEITLGQSAVLSAPEIKTRFNIEL